MLPVWIGGPIVLVVLLVLFLDRSSWLRTLDHQLARWRIQYQLDDATVEKLRRLELEFHGSGNPFTTPIRRSGGETEKHHEAMADLIAPWHREKFLRDLESEELGH